MLRKGHILAILFIVASITAVSEVYGQQFFVKTDKSLYEQGNIIVVSGFIETLNENPNQPVLIRIFDPDNNIIATQQVNVNSDRTYSVEIVAGGTWKTAGEYLVSVNYAGKIAETTFEFTGGEGYTPPPPPPDTTSPLESADPTSVCNVECVMTNYEFGKDKEIDLEVILCLDKWWTGKSLGRECMDLPQYEEMRSKHVELTKLWPNSVIPEFYPMEPYYKQFSYEDIYCLLESEDYKDCLADNGPLDDMKIERGSAYTLLYHGCADTARNLLSIDKITRPDSGYLMNFVCKDFANYIIDVRMNVPEPTPKVPEWVRNIFIWYAEDRISEDELLDAIQFLIDQGILKSKT